MSKGAFTPGAAPSGTV